MASLQDLLAEEGFHPRNSSRKLAKFCNSTAQGAESVVLPKHLCRDGRSPICSVQKPAKSPRRVGSSVRSSERAGSASGAESVVLPKYLCRDGRSPSFSVQKPAKSPRRRGSSVRSSERAGSASGRSNYKSSARKSDEPVIDDVTIKAVASILGGYVGQYLKDERFLKSVREKYESCIVSKTRSFDEELFQNMETAIENIERLVRNLGGMGSETTEKALRNCIRQLNVVASLNSDILKRGTTCGIPNSYLSACAQLYLSIAYKIERSDWMSAQHLLQVFCDSPFLARTCLLPDLWEHLFLPHLLHVKIWYNKEIESISSSETFGNENELKCLSELYNERMDTGTARFAAYYNHWLKVRAEAPSFPDIDLPLKHSHGELSRRKSLDSRRAPMDLTIDRKLQRRRSLEVYASNPTVDKNLYRAVFDSKQESQTRSSEFAPQERDSIRKGGTNYNGLQREIPSTTDTHKWKLQGAQSEYQKYNEVDLWRMSEQSSYFPPLRCQSVPTICSQSRNRVARNDRVENRPADNYISDDIGKAISMISRSDVLSACEAAIHTVTKAWLTSPGDCVIESLVSRPPFIEGTLEILSASNDDEVLELAISFLAEIVVRNDLIGHTILNFDPQLDIFIRLLRRTSVFLKAAILLYLLKPQAKQMISSEWVLLTLRVLEFGDQTQILFKFRCVPRIAAFYVLNQLLLGFDEDKNLENARELVSLGGLSMLMERFRLGADYNDRKDIATFIFCCIKADGMCRNYVAEHITHSSLLELLVLELHKSSKSALRLLTELLCLVRRSQINELLHKMRNGWTGLKTMHILLIYLQKVSLEEQPLVAAILLLFGLLEDSSKCSLYQEEALDAIMAALCCESCSQKVQEQCARCLWILTGRFSVDGEASTEQWILEQSGFQESIDGTVHGRDFVVATKKPLIDEEEKTWQWQRKAALTLLNSGRGKILHALSNSLADGIPTLSRACLVTISWLSSFLHFVDDKSLQMEACSVLIPQLLKSLKFDRELEERVLATVTLLNLVKNTGCYIMLYPLKEDTTKLLSNLSLVTWTAKELLSMEYAASRSR